MPAVVRLQAPHPPGRPASPRRPVLRPCASRAFGRAVLGCTLAGASEGADSRLFGALTTPARGRLPVVMGGGREARSASAARQRLEQYRPSRAHPIWSWTDE